MIGSLWLLSKHLYLGLLFVQPLFRKKNKQSIHKFSLFNEPRLRPTNHRAVNGGASLYSITWHHKMELRPICCSAADANGGRQPEHDLLLKVVLQAGRSPPHQTPPPVMDAAALALFHESVALYRWITTWWRFTARQTLIYHWGLIFLFSLFHSLQNLDTFTDVSK